MTRTEGLLAMKSSKVALVKWTTSLSSSDHSASFSGSLGGWGLYKLWKWMVELQRDQWGNKSDMNVEKTYSFSQSMIPFLLFSPPYLNWGFPCLQQSEIQKHGMNRKILGMNLQINRALTQNNAGLDILRYYIQLSMGWILVCLHSNQPKPGKSNH